MSLRRPQKDEPFEFRLERYYSVIGWSGVLTPIIVCLAMWLLPGLFPWIEPAWYGYTLAFMIAVAAVNAVNIGLFRIYHQRLFFTINRYVFVALFMEFIAVSGGIHSIFLFLLLFPTIVSVVDLDPKMTRRIGVLICLFLSLLIYAHPADLYDPVSIAEYILEVGLFAILSWYMYVIVRETLRQKYERDEASRKFTRLIEVEELKNDFLQIDQHQLRTPLSGIRYALESLRGDASVSADAKALIDSGISRVGDALGIVNVMLTAAETGVKDLALECVPSNLSSIVQSLLDDLAYVAKQKEILVHVHLPQNVTVCADVKRLKPAIANVVDNAFKYAPHGKVDIDLTEDAKNAILRVRDNGIGIPAGDKGFVFNRLYRGANAVALEPDQSGVGLYTAKRIIELHKGAITLESEVGKGTTVTITLPK